MFVGFDGNEKPHFGVANMLVKELNRFTEWADRPLTTYSRTIDKYRRMKAVYDRLDIPHADFLELGDIRSILDA